MKAIEFPQMTAKIAEDQPQYQTLPAHISDEGIVTAYFELDAKEREQVAENGKIYLSIHTMNNLLQPIGTSVLDPWKDKHNIDKFFS